MADSPSPKVWMRLWTSTPLANPLPASLGATSSWNIPIISRGGPGRAATMAPLSRIQMPGAVPRALNSTSEPLGNIACTRFRSGRGRFRFLKIPSMCRHDGSWYSSGAPASSARISRVRSSSVGPNPPVLMTRPALRLAIEKQSRLAARSSAMVVCQPTSIPCSASSRLSQALLVSRLRPEVSSLPIEMISALVMRLGSGGDPIKMRSS